MSNNVMLVYTQAGYGFYPGNRIRQMAAQIWCDHCSWILISESNSHCNQHAKFVF